VSLRSRLSALLRALAAAALLAAPAAAQTVRVTSGEHAGFTRIVLQSPVPFGWSLAPSGRERRLRVAAEAVLFDPSEIFRVIPRTRLADLRHAEGGLALILDCDCEIRTDEPAAGVVVLDIRDGPPRRRPAPRALAAAPGDLARTAGEDLARRMRASGRTDSAAPGEAPAPALSPRTLIENLARQMTQAVAQGLLEADPEHSGDVAPPAVSGQVGTDLSNLRIAHAAGVPGESPPDARDACPEPDLFDFGDDDTTPPFLARHGELMRALYGEFDLPDAGTHEALARLYLEHAFGAEARQVLDNAPAQVPGRDLLLGLADVLEGRYSNARLRLSERVGCTGAAGLFAALAGADPAQIERQSLQIASVYTDLPVALRRALGEPLVRRLLDARAIEAARMVADALGRAPGPPAQDLPLLEAMLDAARGDVDRAAARLDHAGSRDAATLVVRLRLALERGEDPDPALLADAEAVAAGERATATGIEIMSLLIDAHNAARRPEEGFALLDRLARWLPTSEVSAATLAGLRDATWAALVADADDRRFLQTYFDRADGRRDMLAAPTRLTLAARLANFALTDAAGELLAGMPEAEARRLRARLRFLDGDPAAALDELSGLQDDAAARLRAQAQHALAGAEVTALAASGASEPDAGTAEEPAPETDGLLLRGTALLSESVQLREALGDLLQSDR
jgi:hypothetical protein